MPKITLTFNVSDEVAQKLVPSVGIYASLSTANIDIEITNEYSTDDDFFAGVNAELSIKED